MALSINELNSLAAGVNITSTQASNTPATAVVVSGAGSQSSPIVCDVQPTQSVNLNQLNVTACSTQVIRMTYTNEGEVPRYLIFGGGAEDNTIFNLHPELGIASANSPFSADVTSNTPFASLNVMTNGGLLGRFNETTETGIGVCRLTVRFASDQTWSSNQANEGITLFTYPVDINNSVLKKFDYSPFCDACYNSNLNNRTTLQFDLGAGAPMNLRQGIYYRLEAGATVTFEFEICYGSQPNTAIIPTSQFFI